VPMKAGGMRSPARYAWFVLAMLVMSYGFNFMDRYLFIISMESIRKDLHLTDTQLGIISGFAFAAFYSVAGVFVARWADRGNRALMIPVALTVWSALTGACGLARNFLQLLLVRVGVGVAESAGSPPALSMLSDLFPPQRRATAFALYSSGIYLGMALGFVIGGWVGDHYGWRWSFVTGAVPGMLFALLMRLTVREPARGAADDTHVERQAYGVQDTLRYLARRPTFLVYMLGSALFVFVGTAMDYWGPLFMIRVHGMNAASVGLWTGALGATVGITGAFISGVLSDRLAGYDLRWYLAVSIGGIALEVPATLLFLYGPAHTAVLWYCVSLFFDSFSMPATLAITHRIMPIRLRALASAIMLLGYNLIGVSGCNFVIGFFSDLWAGLGATRSLQYAMTLTQVAVLIGAACTLYAVSRLPRDFPQHFPARGG